MVFTACLLSLHTYAREWDLGLQAACSSNWMLFMREQSPNAYATSGKENMIQFMPMLALYYRDRHQLEWGVQYGYAPLYGRYNATYYSGDHTTQTYSETHVKGNMHALQVSLGKPFSWRSYVLIPGIQLPFSLNYGQSSHIVNNELSSSAYLIRQTVLDTKYPLNFSAGLYMSQAVYYKLTSRFMAGFILQAGLRVNMIRGVEKQDVMITDYLTMPPTPSRSETLTSTRLHSLIGSMDFLPVLSVRYCLNKPVPSAEK